MKRTTIERRGIITAGIGIASLLVGAEARAKDYPKKKGEVDAKENSAVEALMREHGVLRRCFLVYRESAGRLRIDPAGVDAGALNETAKLFRDFGEDYHQKKLEEAHIFPRIRNQVPHAAASVDTLILQHQRGREITDYVLSATSSAKIAATDAESLARAFDSFEVMYANHAAREDTLVFPAWKAAVSSKEIAEAGELFEDIERAEFGTDGFEDALKRIASAEEKLGLAALAQFTAPAPPRSAPP